LIAVRRLYSIFRGSFSVIWAELKVRKNMSKGILYIVAIIVILAIPFASINSQQQKQDKKTWLWIWTMCLLLETALMALRRRHVKGRPINWKSIVLEMIGFSAT